MEESIETSVSSPRLRNDPFAASPAALVRGAGHLHAVPRSKMAGLLAPLVATGVPLGGIGTGSIVRSSDGSFSQWTLPPQGPRAFDLLANGFLLRVRRDGAPPVCRALRPAPGVPLPPVEFEDAAPEWCGLFPFAWHRHAPVKGVEAQCLSLSPFLPGDLATSALPVSLFRWRLSNGNAEPRHEIADCRDRRPQGLAASSPVAADRSTAAPSAAAATTMVHPRPSRPEAPVTRTMRFFKGIAPSGVMSVPAIHPLLSPRPW